ncbi:redoxin domain-containing protein [Streptomyces sp. SID9913]|uniref:Redoxin domain-containing protein n=3 Tax=Streptomyces TaxID=1883 RepID=A0A6G3QP09_9ACTN|nr:MULTISPECIES: thioredoxin-like domain-containing protein [Streptomyces]MCP8712346.1 redoxin domain-containing protein [Streptomyces sp. AC04842]AVV45428.1 mercury transporter [Streptomyces sp. P3]EGG44383.1 putative mercury resistance operon [Streptomyces griseoaurantiacus M045]KOV62915.1 mercury transporter [Streptomyces sp. AS58]NEA84930.1 redoxin domain-containing protein [Streptomyces sp. SID14436]
MTSPSPTARRTRLRRRTVLALAAATAAVLTLSACGTATTGSTAKTDTVSGSSAAAKTDTVTLLDDTTLAVPGKKPAALFFFSVGCGECAGGAKSLDKAAKAFGDKATFLAVDMDPSESKTTIMQFLDYIKAPGLATTVDKGAALSLRYQVSALSTLIVVDPQGKVTYRATDPSADQIQAALKKAGA